MKERGILIVVSGFSGSGKGTLMKELLERYKDRYALSVSATTRRPREGEIHGREYFFLSRDEFEKMIAKDELIEYANLNIKKMFPDALLLFVTPPDADELRRRLVGRGTETMDVIKSRMDRACEEAEGMENYDYLIVNDSLDECVREMHAIIQGEHRRTSRNREFVKRIKEDLERLKGEE